MNEQIRQLVLKAGGRNSYSFSETQPWKFSVSEVEKFAELIVQECITLIEPSQYHRAYPDNMLGSYDGLELLDQRVYRIKQHFDV